MNLGKCLTTCVAVSQDGSTVGMFALGYQAKCAQDAHGCWMFTAYPADNPATIRQTVLAAVGKQPPFGRWVQLTAVFSTVGPAGLTLYVNGVRKAQNSIAFAPGGTSGVFRLGAGFDGAQPWVGQLSDACAFFDQLGAADVSTLYHGDTAHPHDGCATLFAAYP